MAKRKRGSPRIKTLKDKLWRIVTEYIRRKYADKDGMVKCSTCPTVYHWKDCKGRMQSGHFVPKKYCPPLFFTEENLHPQCNYCNSVGEGQQYEHALFIKKEHGLKTLNKLLNFKYDWRAKKKLNPEMQYKWEKDYLNNLIVTYTQKLNKLPKHEKECQ